MSEKLTAADVLRKYQKQCDEEGIEVQVSRQALDEVLEQNAELVQTLRNAYLEATTGMLVSRAYKTAQLIERALWKHGK